MFHLRDRCRDQNQQWKIRRERVVLLVGGERKEEQDECRKDGKQQCGAAGRDAVFRLGGPGERLRSHGSIGIDTTLPQSSRKERDRRKQAPGKEPDQVKAPVKVAGKLVVVTRRSPAQKTQDVLIDEVEPEEAVPIHSLRIPQSS